MTKRMTSIRLSDMTDRQLAELSQRTGMNQSDIISIAIDRMAREERQNTMNERVKELAIESCQYWPAPPEFVEFLEGAVNASEAEERVAAKAWVVPWNHSATAAWNAAAYATGKLLVDGELASDEFVARKFCLAVARERARLATKDMTQEELLAIHGSGGGTNGPRAKEYNRVFEEQYGVLLKECGLAT